jgi:hypothetical protein
MVWPHTAEHHSLWIAAVIRSTGAGQYLQANVVLVPGDDFQWLERNPRIVAWIGPYRTRAEAARALPGLLTKLGIPPSD